MDLDQRGAIGRETKIGPMSKGDEPGGAQQQIVAEANQGEDRDLGRDRVGQADRDRHVRQHEERRCQDH